MRVYNSLLICAGLSAVAAFGAETRVTFASLPAAVQQAAKHEIGGARIRGCSREEEHGRKYYEVETAGTGGHRDLLFDEAGKLVEVEQEVKLESIPAAAREALEKEAAGGRIVSVESSKRGSRVNYEAVIEANGKKREFAVSANGAPVKED